MFEAASFVTAASPVAGRAVPPEADIEAIVPLQPATLRDTGLERPLVLALLAKTIARFGKAHLPVLGGKLRLSVSVLREALALMLADQLVEVARRGDSDIDIEYQLTAAGHAFAAAALAECRYVGPAPVTLDALREVIIRDARRHASAANVGDAELAAALGDGGGDGIVDAVLRAQLGAALQSGRAVLLYGATGCGKTTVARKLGRLLQGVVGVPYAVLIDEQIVQFYDPLIHLAPAPAQGRLFDERRNDSRWLICQRPLLQVGSELTPPMLDCRFDAINGIYYAPVQLQASGGLLIVDDLGSQRCVAAALLNRLAGPLEHGVDVLTLQGGRGETVPFTAKTVLTTSDAPHALFDARSLRRIAYKIEIGAVAAASYLALLRRQCALKQVSYDEAAARYLLEHLHALSGRPLLVALPGELVARIVDAASFAGRTAQLNTASLEQAWHSLFAAYPPRTVPAVRDHVLLGETS
ncbi:ATP-binding protein [Massilia sp. PWRC2]|uniref:ATP-binding protein n=1 Tax=Massilia sp. PWRC2 TaxID=2804626 RepID=UPI003CEEBA42